LNYDIHTYWRNSDEHAEALRLKELLMENNVQTFSLVEFPVDPHPLPMFEAHVNVADLPNIEVKLAANRFNCSILIHEKTSDHMHYHTVRARWLDTPLELNLEFLRNFRG
jgi:aromatic ring-cleaving dioxygenase